MLSAWLRSFRRSFTVLTHWGRATPICVGKLTIIGSDNGLSPARRQAIIWTNAGILLITPLGTNLNEILIEILTFSFKKMCLKVSSAKWRPFCLGLNVLTHYWGRVTHICVSKISIIIPPLQRSWKGGILVSPCPSVRLVCGQNRVRSVSSTILIGSISYLHILSSNFTEKVCRV